MFKPIRPALLLVLAALLVFAGTASAQYPVMDAIADRVVQKYQQASCQQLWEKKAHPQHSEREQHAIQLLRGDPQMRRAFIDRIAAPIANKMFDCGLIP